MADLFNRLTATRFAEHMRRKHGEDAVLESIAPELQLVDLVDDHAEPEDAFSAQRILFWGRETTAALAANNSGCGIRNDLSNNLIIVERARIAHAALITDYSITNRATSAVGINSSSRPFTVRDSRWGTGVFSTNAGVLSLQLRNTSTLGNFGEQWAATANEDLTIPDLDVVIAPGSELHIWCLTQNQNITVSWKGYVLPVKPEALGA